MDLTTIEDYLRQYGWSYEEVKNEKDILITQFSTDSNDLSFAIIIQLALPWLRMRIPVYSPLPSLESQPSFFERLLQINFSSRQVFFALDEHHHLTLCVDLFIEEEFGYTPFEVALTSLAYTAETAYPFLNGTIESGNQA